jgi:hypothetical protein
MSGINWETLGCRLYTPDDCAAGGQRTPITSLISYMSNLIETMIAVQDSIYHQIEVDQFRTIDIPDCCVSSTDFDIQLDPPDETYEMLCRAGAEAARTYLGAYRLPERGEGSSPGAVAR